jgi:hypothetical protein
VTLRRITRIGGPWLLLGGALVALGWAALAPMPPLAPSAREVVYVIPKGAAARSAGGEIPSGLPSWIHLRLGVRDILVLRNDDEQAQQFGPVRLAPGQTYRFTFDQPEVLQLACSFHQGIGFVIFVDAPLSPGWERLVWRLGLVRE